MVEDEFLATAQSYTRHLHHAEYQRLKILAKDRNASNITSISRPTDNATMMRSELRLQKEMDERQIKARKGVEDILSYGNADMRASSESDFERHSDNEPWQGTRLQSFITATPKKDLKSLTGLHGVISYTRAAAGFTKSEKSPTRTQRSIFLRDPKADVVQDDDDTDDLDALVSCKSKNPIRTTTLKPQGFPTLIRDKLLPRKEVISQHNQHQVPEADNTAASRARVQARRDRDRKTEEELEKRRHEEIPMFLA